jgi:hypothetical protein
MSYRQSHALYVLHEIKWIVCQCIVFMEKCISVPHDRNNFVLLSFSWEKNILTEEGSEIFFYEHNENPRPPPPLIRKWLLPYTSGINNGRKVYAKSSITHEQTCTFKMKDMPIWTLRSAKFLLLDAL